SCYDRQRHTEDSTTRTTPRAESEPPRLRRALTTLIVLGTLLANSVTIGVASARQAVWATPTAAPSCAQPVIRAEAAAGSTSHTSPAAYAQPVKPWIQQARLAELRAVNYFPVQHGWGLMWSHWDPRAIDADFGRIEALDANSVRIILQATTIGYPTPQP